ncbi:PE-PPE domain-containing protein [Mycobacterium uberis]|uniref:PE-PPE domain-containing protein n=1 Tax=Mycobacterium uberis TaxID=2162698 RepID=A0A3E1HDY9_9MYCO|nr:PE-PPE domain-containing protein [Mycobacterium uberis]RFD24539.1 PE-PPE domain-containing protein [Mycobacterium uberis]
MKRLLTAALAALTVGAAGGFGPAVASGEAGTPWEPWLPPSPVPVREDSPAKVVYTLGGARPPAFDWGYYTMRAGEGFFPDVKRKLIDYPAGAIFRYVPTFLVPGPRDEVTIGEAITVAAKNLNQAIHQGTEPGAVVGLSQGSLALDTEQARLATDPMAPPPDQFTFNTFGDPSGYQGFGKGVLASIFQPGDSIPLIDYTMPPRVDSQYDSNRIVAAYDGLSDFPDRADNLLAQLNCLAGAAISHTPSAFLNPSDVPPQNIKTTINSRGAKTTTYFIPLNHLPLTLPLRYLGWSDALVDQIDAVLQPKIDAAYAYNDNPFNKPVSVDPVNGMDPITNVDPELRDNILDAFAQVRSLLSPPPS